MATAIASASTSSADSTIIRLVNNQSCDGLKLGPLNRNLEIVGGFARRGSTIGDESTMTIRGAVNGGSAFLIATADTFRSFVISNLDVSDGSGGADGTGAENSIVTGINNNAHDVVALPGSVSLDPGFVDAEAGNFRSRGDSPNVDSRTPPASTYNEDVEGNPR